MLYVMKVSYCPRSQQKQGKIFTNTFLCRMRNNFSFYPDEEHWRDFMLDIKFMMIFLLKSFFYFILNGLFNKNNLNTCCIIKLIKNVFSLFPLFQDFFLLWKSFYPWPPQKTSPLQLKKKMPNKAQKFLWLTSFIFAIQNRENL